MAQEITTFIVDSFTDQPFKGNPAGVCLLDKPLAEDQMQNIASELNLSETAFIWEEGDYFNIRYFSPKMEIPLCGHATLASAWVLHKHIGTTEISFMTGERLDLKVTTQGNWLTMQFPRYETTAREVPKGMLEALGLETTLNSVYNAETNILLLEIDDSQLLKEMSPDFNALIKTDDSINGVLVTAPDVTGGFDFHSRYFWPWSGSNEDPVTGATHTFLAPYWSEKLGKTKLRSFQASQRTGFMELELDQDILFIKGKAVLVLEGKLIINNT